MIFIYSYIYLCIRLIVPVDGNGNAKEEMRITDIYVIKINLMNEKRKRNEGIENTQWIMLQQMMSKFFETNYADY